MSAPVVVLGAGIAGLTAAATLRRLRIPTIILERDNAGGILRDLHLQFPDDACGACRVASCLTDSCLRLRPRIEGVDIISPAEVVSLSGEPPRMVLRYRRNGVEKRLDAAAVIVATGGRPADCPPHLKQAAPEKVLTLYEAERRLWNGWLPKGRVAVALCAGSRTAEYPVCGSFCCLASLRLAWWLRQRGVDVTLFAMDIRASEREEWEYARRRLESLHLVRCRINHAEPAPNGVRLGWEESGRVVWSNFDWLICATPQRPEGDLPRRLGLKADEFGFVPYPESGRGGVFACGYAAGPCTIKEAVEQAQAAAVRVAASLGVKPRTTRPPRVAVLGEGHADGRPYPPQVLVEILARFGVEAQVVEEPRFERIPGAVLVDGAPYGAVVLGHRTRRYRPPAPDGVLWLSEADENICGDVAFVLCVGAFEDGRGCGMTCCRDALTLAVRLKERDPDRNVIILTKEVMTRGLSERLFDEARRKGVLVVRYPHGKTPQVERAGRRWRLTFFDTAVWRKQTIRVDAVVFGDWWEFERAGWELRETKYGRRRLGGGFVGFEGEPYAVAAEVLGVLCGEGFKQVVSRRRCYGCGRCVEVCPQGARWLRDGLLVTDATLCVGCFMCVAACPAGACAVEEKGYAHSGVSV